MSVFDDSQSNVTKKFTQQNGRTIKSDGRFGGEQSTKNMIIQCPACKTRFSIELTQLKGITQPRFHCSRCAHYFGMEEVDVDQLATTDKAVGNGDNTANQTSSQTGSSLKTPLHKTQMGESTTQPGGPSLEQPPGRQLDLIPESSKRASTKNNISSTELPVVTAEWPDYVGSNPLEADLRSISPSFPEVMKKRRALTGRPNPLSDSLVYKPASAWSSVTISSAPSASNEQINNEQSENQTRKFSLDPRRFLNASSGGSGPDSSDSSTRGFTLDGVTTNPWAASSPADDGSNLARKQDLNVEDFDSVRSQLSETKNFLFADGSAPFIHSSSYNSALDKLSPQAEGGPQASEDFFIDGDGEIYASDFKLKEHYSSKLPFSKKQTSPSMLQDGYENIPTSGSQKYQLGTGEDIEDHKVPGMTPNIVPAEHDVPPKLSVNGRQREDTFGASANTQTQEKNVSDQVFFGEDPPAKKLFSLGKSAQARTPADEASHMTRSIATHVALSSIRIFVLVLFVPFVLIAGFWYFSSSNSTVLDSIDTLRKVIGSRSEPISSSELEIDKPVSKVIALQNSKNSLEIRGSLTNRSFRPVGEIVLEALLFDENNTVVSRTRAYSDNLLTAASSVANVRKEDISSMLNTRTTPVSTLQVGKQEVFRIVVPEVPASASWFTVKVVTATTKE